MLRRSRALDSTSILSDIFDTIIAFRRGVLRKFKFLGVGLAASETILVDCG